MTDDEREIKMVVAMVRPDKLGDVKQSLAEVGAPSLTVTSTPYSSAPGNTREGSRGVAKTCGYRVSRASDEWWTRRPSDSQGALDRQFRADASTRERDSRTGA